MTDNPAVGTSVPLPHLPIVLTGDNGPVGFVGIAAFKMKDEPMAPYVILNIGVFHFGVQPDTARQLAAALLTLSDLAESGVARLDGKLS